MALLVCLCIFALSATTFGYESVYDIIERNNYRRRFGEPSYFAERRHPGGFHRRYHSFSGIDSVPFGRGYDNLGNGLFHEMDRFRGFRRPSFEVDRGRGIYETRTGLIGNSATTRLGGESIATEGNNQRESDENHRSNRKSLISDVSSNQHSGEKSRSDINGENKLRVHTDRVSKKGKITKGFSSHHHKDETGNSTTFYDEFSDLGGRSDYKDVADGFRSQETSEHSLAKDDAKFFGENGESTGGYGLGFKKEFRKSDGEAYSSDEDALNRRLDRGYAGTLLPYDQLTSTYY